MRVSRSILITILFVSLGTSPTMAASRVHGIVADESGGVLPGVTVVATAPDGQILATGVTDEVGRYALSLLPSPSVRLTLSLEGFSPAIVDVAATADTDPAVPTQRLLLAHQSETVVVRGEARAVVPAPPVLRVLPPPPPRPVLQPLPDHERDSICGPAKRNPTLPSFGTIRAARDKALYGEGDELRIDGGTATGLATGQNLVARRSYRTSSDADGAGGEHTAGVLQIVTAEEHGATAVVVYACDELSAGDWLAPFNPEPVRGPEPAGRPAYDRAARILLTDEGQLIGAPRRLMVIDQGRDAGVRVGQRLTLFRPARRGARRPAIIGEAVVVALRDDSATIRVQRAIDPIAIGDSAAPQR